MINKVSSLQKLHGRKSLFEMRGMENILGLSYPEKYSCEVRTYHADYKQMSIRIFENPDILSENKYFYLDLTLVYYFEGPVNWNGANFQLLNAEDNYRVMKKFPRFKDVIDSDTSVTSFVIRLIGHQSYDVYISANSFDLKFGKYIPEFEDGILLP
jgi:hypothetical protein